jgi:hypothetical protein
MMTMMMMMMMMMMMTMMMIKLYCIPGYSYQNCIFECRNFACVDMT